MVGLLSSIQRSVKLITLGLVNQRLERCYSTSLSLEGGVVDGQLCGKSCKEDGDDKTQKPHSIHLLRLIIIAAFVVRNESVLKA